MYQIIDDTVIVANMSADPLTSPSGREQIRAHIVETASALLADGGVEAVTTRAVGASAGVQAPTIYRLFGDKDGLLDAVAEHGFATWVADKQRRRRHRDPVEDVRLGWRTYVEFGLANPGLALLMADPRRGARSPAIAAGTQVLRDKVHRLAMAGGLAVPESRAVDLLHACGTGVVLTLLSAPLDDRDDGLAEAALRAVLDTIVVDVSAAAGHGAPANKGGGPAAAAITLAAGLDGVTALSDAERTLLADWLQRIAAT
jgi:AcrR family transcriptional regulator